MAITRMPRKIDAVLVFEMVTPDGHTLDNNNNAIDKSNSDSSPKGKQGVAAQKSNVFGPVDLAAFWALPIAPVALLADVLSTSPQGIGRMGFPTYRIGGGLYVKPIEVAHRFRALKSEGGAK